MRRSTSSGARWVEVRLNHLDLRRQGRLVLEDICWTIRPGQRWVLAGGNGAGKTQLLKVVAGAVWPTFSDSLARQPRPPAVRVYRWRGERFLTPFEVQDEIGYVGPERQDKYERYGWNHTVEQIVGTGVHRTDIPLHPLDESDHHRIASVLDALAIPQLAQRRFLSLSYGERRLALLARTLASRPKLLLLDELLNGLDDTHHERALRWLQQTRRSSLPWVLATHRYTDLPVSATHTLVLDQGRIVYKGILGKAPLERWLSKPKRTSRRTREPTRRTGGLLIRLSRASVYLDENPVLQNLSLEIRRGHCWVVHGHNGSGKTTLLRTLYGDHAVAYGGRIERAGIVAGVPLQRFKRKVGLVAPHLQADHPQELTVAEVVQSGRHASVGLNDAPTAADRAAASRSLRFFGLSPLASRSVRELSYGQMRRVLFARAWVCVPSLLLLDEPFSGVDGPTRAQLVEDVAAMISRGAAVVLSTHHRLEWPAHVTHELELAHGRAVYCGPVRSPATIRARSRTGNAVAVGLAGVVT